jgi:hypothetical protein
VAAVVSFLKGLASLQGKVPDEATRRNRWNAAVGLRDTLSKMVGVLRKEAKAVLEEHRKPPVHEGDTNPSRRMHGGAAALMTVSGQGG